MDRQRVGVLGATSLLGESLLPLLVQHGWQVAAFSRRPAGRNDAQQDELEITWRQLAGHTAIRMEAKKEEIASWLCVAPIWTLPEYFDFLLAHGARRVVALSSTSRFTKGDSSDPGEQAVALRLTESEERLRVWASAHGVEWVILRPTLIYGHGRDKNIAEIARFIRRFGFFPLLGRANGLRQPVHVDDIASVCLAALVTPHVANQAYNLAGGETLPYREMVSRVFGALDRRPRLLTVPRWIFRLAMQGLRWLPRYRHWTTAMAERMNRDLVFDYADAQRDLHFAPRSFQLAAKDLPFDDQHKPNVS